MRLLIVIIILLLVTVIHAGDNALPGYECSYVDSAIAIDGKLDESAWPSAQKIRMVKSVDGCIPVEPTEVRMLWNEENLYLSFECAAKSVNAKYSAHDQDLYKENEVVEVFIENDIFTYFEFQVNPLNARFDALIFGCNYPGGKKLLKSYNPESFKSAVAVHRENGKISRWTAEMKIAWTDLGRPGKATSRWRINLARLNQINGNVEFSAWSPCGENIHRQDLFGELILTRNYNGITPFMSNTWEDPQSDILVAFDGKMPQASSDSNFPRISWWPKKGTSEWVEYRFDKPREISSATVYWFDDSGRNGGCKIPKNSLLTYYDGQNWHKISNFKGDLSQVDRLNSITFPPVKALAVRLEVRLAENYSGGIYELSIK
jgi:hypothetical protein